MIFIDIGGAILMLFSEDFEKEQQMKFKSSKKIRKVYKEKPEHQS